MYTLRPHRTGGGPLRTHTGYKPSCSALKLKRLHVRVRENTWCIFLSKRTTMHYQVYWFSTLRFLSQICLARKVKLSALRRGPGTDMALWHPLSQTPLHSYAAAAAAESTECDEWIIINEAEHTALRFFCNEKRAKTTTTTKRVQLSSRAAKVMYKSTNRKTTETKIFVTIKLNSRAHRAGKCVRVLVQN